MLESFFPKPKQFFFCAIMWSLLGVFSWYFGGKEFGLLFGFDFPKKDAPPGNWAWTFYNTGFLVVLYLLLRFYITFLCFLGVLLPTQMAIVVYFGFRADIIFHILSSAGSRCGQQLVSPLL